LVAVVGLILVTAYFVAGEFAFVAVRRGRLEELAAAGDRKAETAVEVHRRLSFMLSGAQLGITATSLVIGFIAEPTVGRALSPIVGAVGVPESARSTVSVTVGFVLATAAQMVVGELAPKNIAIARAESTARALAGSTLLFMRMAAPVIRFFDNSANRLLRIFGVEPVEELHGGVSTDELDFIVEESAGEGKLTRRQAALLTRTLGFGELYAASVMVPWTKVETLPETASGEDLRQAMADTAHSRFPIVTADGKVVGIVHAKDLLAVPARQLAAVSVGGLVGPVVVVPEVARLRAVLDHLRRGATEMALVVDEYGAPAGVVTLEDLVEELVGDIADEHDVDDPGAEDDGSGAWSVPGRWRPDEIARVTGLVLPDGDYDTVAGLVLARLGRLAVVGDTVEVAGALIEVTEVDGWAIDRVRLEPATDDADSDADSGDADRADTGSDADGATGAGSDDGDGDPGDLEAER
jgi:CBS domain containing-hemolysin-like protein